MKSKCGKTKVDTVSKRRGTYREPGNDWTAKPNTKRLQNESENESESDDLENLKQNNLEIKRIKLLI